MLIKRIRYFSPEAIANSGQCFRMRITAPRRVEVIHRGRLLYIEDLGEERFGFSCSEEEFHQIWHDYFDLSNDYGKYLSAVDVKDAFLMQAAQAGRGLRILRQDPWETLIGFLLSQRKSIPAIRDGMEKLSRRFGSPISAGGRLYYVFPGPKALAEASLEELKACSLGYRAPYINAAAMSVANGVTDLSALNELDDGDLFKRLIGFDGVGVKVASCVMLFGYHRLNAAPVDVWIQRVIDEEYAGVSPFDRYQGIAGIIQQYMFYDRIQKKHARKGIA